MSLLLYKQDYDIICQRLLPELKKLENNLEQYEKLVAFLIVAEDHRYYKHIGFDIVGICRAIYKDFFLGKREGASTIEQQLVRLLTGDYRYSMRRKVKEIYLATKLKRLANKYTLAAAYLDLANYGTGLSGLNAVLNRLGTTLQKDLNDEICAGVVARLKYPEPKQANSVRMERIEQRTKHIIRLYHQYESRDYERR